jgi:hypothetical protein
MLLKNAHKKARVRKAWLDRRKEIITTDSCCDICGVSSANSILQIHHVSKDAYKEENFHLYETLSPDLPFILLCKKCHLASHRGLDLCPICGDHYKLGFYPQCFHCAVSLGKLYKCPDCGQYSSSTRISPCCL